MPRRAAGGFWRGESLREQGTGNREQGTCRVPQVLSEHVPEPLRENPSLGKRLNHKTKFEATHEEAQVSSSTQKAGWLRDSVSIIHFVSVCWFLGCVLCCEKRLKWVRVNTKERPSQSYTSFCYEVWVSNAGSRINFSTLCPKL